ncbi:putative methyltransferase-domain-containing protein [Coniochaeta sp. 2T2.1]|nr:putative methyltransferase-domain-containing protein [Coniochaeta sp. 2T2.1]
MLPDEFPHLWQKPAFAELLGCLEKLQFKPPVWGVKVSRGDTLREQNADAKDRHEISRFLSSIISSNLTWIDNDDQREELWTVASRRLAERCGRTAMGELTRAFQFQQEDGTVFDITIREPPITGESLGLKTWGSSYVMAKLLPQLAKGSLRPALDAQRSSKAPVLELGSGTGLLGLAAACFWRVPVTLTDLPTIVPNLTHNVHANRPIADGFGGQVDAVPLTWGDREETDVRFQVPHRHRIVIAADPLYDDDHPALLASAIHEQLSLTASAVAMVMIPLRDETTRKLKAAFLEEMLNQSNPLVAVDQDFVTGQDDWGEDDEGQEVNCWWGIFARVELN